MLKRMNIFRNVLTYCLLLVLMMMSVSALEITDEQFLVADSPLDAISFKKAQVVTITFSIETNNSLDSVTGDFSSLNSNPDYRIDYKNMNLLEHCTKEYSDDGETIDRYDCTVDKIVMSLNSPSVSLPITVIQDTGTSQELTFEQEFDIDSTRPVVTAIKSSYCEEDTCYIGRYTSSKVNIHIDDDTGSFDQKNIFYKLGSQGLSNRVDNCTSGMCTGYLNAIDCSSGESVPLFIGSLSGVQSTDDAKNPLAGELSTTLVCDEYAPAEQKTLTNGSKRCLCCFYWCW